MMNLNFFWSLTNSWLSVITQNPSSFHSSSSAQFSQLSSNPSPSTSTIYVQHTSRIHASRPAGFGPHFSNPDGELMQLLPIDAVTTSVSATTNQLLPARRGCPPDSTDGAPLTFSTSPHPANWVALVERGTCTFVDKIRYAQQLGASAVIVGDWDQTSEAYSGSGSGMAGPVFYTNLLIGSDKFSFGSGLVTMYAPGDTSDLDIPSVFVARDSYLSLRADWSSLNLHHQVSSNKPDASEDFSSHPTRLPQSLEVIMSQDELWTWPFFDLLIILLFLPSILTLLTLVLHRINLVRKRRADRAPREFVDRLPCVIWVKDMEKGIPVAPESAGPDSSPPPESMPASHWIVKNYQVICCQVQALLRRPFSQRSASDVARSTDSEQTPLLDPGRRPGKPRGLIPPPKVYFAQRECALCLSDFEVGDLVRILPCGHCFHQGEIAQHCMGIDYWLLKSRRLCPICRMSIMDDGEPTKDDQPRVGPGPVPILAAHEAHDPTASSSAPMPFVSTGAQGISAPSSSSVTLDQTLLATRHHQHRHHAP